MLILAPTSWTTAAEQTFADAGCFLDPGEVDVVAAVVDGATLRLSSGIEVRLGSLEPPSGIHDATATALLTEIALGREVELRYGEVRTDRYGRTVAQVYVRSEPELWLQAALVERGLARVAGTREDRACIGTLLAFERLARAQGLGLWPLAPALDAIALALRTIDGAFTLVEGTVVSIGRRERTVYLNFGTDWTTDFTVSFPISIANRFEEEGGNLDALVGHRIRVRGWLTQREGPWISLDHAEQIEILDVSRVQ
jgi:endonuclease YncB( thermonuclease family)